MHLAPRSWRSLNTSLSAYACIKPAVDETPDLVQMINADAVQHCFMLKRSLKEKP